MIYGPKGKEGATEKKGITREGGTRVFVAEGAGTTATVLTQIESGTIRS